MIKINKIANGVYSGNCPQCGQTLDLTNIVALLENPSECREELVLNQCARCKENTLTARYNALINTMRNMPVDKQCTDKSGVRNHNPSVDECEFCD